MAQSETGSGLCHALAHTLEKKFKIPHLSTGDILRKKILENNSISIDLKKIMNSGNYVSDEVLNTIIENRINNSDCKNGFVLDGYPRPILQKKFLSNFLDKNNLHINFIFDLFIEDNVIINRIVSRSNIEERKDDDEEVIKIRISKYMQETKPLSLYYSSTYPKIYKIINGNQEIEKIHQDILKIAKI